MKGGPAATLKRTARRSRVTEPERRPGRPSPKRPARTAAQLVRRLARQAGDEAVQAALVVGPANDRFEREATAVASRVAGGGTVDRTVARSFSPGVERVTVDDAAQSLRRQANEEAEESAQTLRRVEGEAVQPLRRQSEEDSAQALRRTGETEAAQPMVEEGVQPLRRMEGEAVQSARRQPAEASAQALRRTGETETAQPLRRMEEGSGAAEAVHMVRREMDGRIDTIRRQEEEAAEESWPEPEEGEVEAVEVEGRQDADMDNAPEVQPMRRQEIGPEGGPVADPGVRARVASPGKGRPLPEGLQARLEPQLGADLSGVRVHDTEQDQADAQAISARAFTKGKHIWLGPGESPSDTKLMAHELTHVMQQGAAPLRSPSAAVTRAPQRVQRLGWDTVRRKLAGWARDIPGYNLLTVAIGYDPVAGESVERNATNLVRGVLSIVPGGNRLFENLKKSGALDRAFAWFSEQISALKITWNGVKALFTRAWDALGWRDALNPWGAWKKVKAIFKPTLSRLLRFAKAVGKKVLEFVFEGVMALAGPLGKRVVGVVRKAGATFMTIVTDPIGFLKNLLGAVMKGFKQFSTNILKHLKAGIMGWLFGTLGDAGLQMPEKFDLKGILSIVLQVLGITYDRMRAKLVKVIGEKRVAYMEKAVAFLKLIVTEGVAGVWKKIVEYLAART